MDSRNNPFRQAIQAKRTLVALYPAVQTVEIVLGGSGPFLRVQDAPVELPVRINGFLVQHDSL